uniref:Uncharacterized protein n=1 Tax=Leptocylindrus danicus TaxID=163516 RepID=A0A7S2L378_9STRA
MGMPQDNVCKVISDDMAKSYSIISKDGGDIIVQPKHLGGCGSEESVLAFGDCCDNSGQVTPSRARARSLSDTCIALSCAIQEENAKLRGENKMLRREKKELVRVVLNLQQNPKSSLNELEKELVECKRSLERARRKCQESTLLYRDLERQYVMLKVQLAEAQSGEDDQKFIAQKKKVESLVLERELLALKQKFQNTRRSLTRGKWWKRSAGIVS